MLQWNHRAAILRTSVYVVCAEVALAKVVWSYRMELSGKNGHIGILVDNPPGSSRSAE